VDVSTTAPGPDFSGLGETGGGQSGLKGKDAQELARDLLAAVSRQQQADGSSGIESGAGTRRVLTPDTPRMRSSIACVRCRRSKVKCLNEGVNTPCRACKVSGRDCIYPSPASREQSHIRDENVDRTGDNGLASPGVSRL
jgi:ribosomal protein L37AE/L43A